MRGAGVRVAGAHQRAAVRPATHRPPEATQAAGWLTSRGQHRSSFLWPLCAFLAASQALPAGRPAAARWPASVPFLAHSLAPYRFPNDLGRSGFWHSKRCSATEIVEIPQYSSRFCTFRPALVGSGTTHRHARKRLKTHRHATVSGTAFWHHSPACSLGQVRTRCAPPRKSTRICACFLPSALLAFHACIAGRHLT